MNSRLSRLIGIPLITFSLFVFECSDPQYYFVELIWSFFMVLILWTGNRLIISRLDAYIPWREKAAPRVFIQLGLSILLTIWVAYIAGFLLYKVVYQAHFSSLAFRKYLFIFLIISLLYNALHTGYHFFQNWRLSMVKAEELKRESLKAQYDSLKNQINPHFLFNSINTLIGLIDEDPELAKNYGVQFAKIYRYILEKGSEELIALSEELNIVKIQQELFESRFGAGLVFKIDVTERANRLCIPPLTLQMLVENAIKHNIISESKPLTIHIRSVEDDKLIVTNNKQGKNVKGDNTMLGIENIKQRVSYLSEHVVKIEDLAEQFIVSIPLLDNPKK
jgi:two-component system, LytTR family, sensor kinase